MNDLLVMKFGGTSVGSAERMRVAAGLAAKERKQRPVVVVVSAMSKVTDLLLDTMRHAEAGDGAGVEQNLAALRRRHQEACCELLPAGRQEEVLGLLHDVIDEFERLVRGMAMLGVRPPRSVDEAVAVGERLSAVLVAEFLTADGTPAVAVNARDVVVTDAVFGNASPLMEPTGEKAKARLVPLIEAGKLPVITGFNGATADGRPTTLGRGGSDFSASILAAALDASELWIWTDVDGIMSADPRLVPDALVLEEITYAEAAELAYNGAKVLHPRTLAPLVEKQIPVWSKNSFAPEKPGTKIVPSMAVAYGARAVASMRNVALISIEPASPELNGVQVMARALDAIARVNVEVLVVSSSSYRQNFCVLVREDELERCMQALEAVLALELAHHYVHPIQVDRTVGLLAAVGEGMQGKPGLAGRIFTAISRVQVNIIAIAQGSSELTIAVVVGRDGLERAVKAVHAECGLGLRPPVPVPGSAKSDGEATRSKRKPQNGD
ncbi:MAG TPA: aspartate kinase [Candidatus Acidoferrales bacterium]|nr:aspartate kinase [Candidatus Acidoferrales bacterium]